MSKAVDAWNVESLPCPDCGQYKVMGLMLTTETDRHQHTWYVCLFWPDGYDTKRCGWTGYSVPGWDDEE